MTAVKLLFILYTNQLFPATYYCNDSCTVAFYLLYKAAVTPKCYCNDSCTVTFYPLYKADFPSFM